MKKVLLSLFGAAFVLSANAQTRMTIHEEFTGENCPPCAATNPDFWVLCNSTSPVDNPSKLIHIAYMAPIPSTGWFYERSKTVNDARRSYYAVTSAPHGKYDGTAAGSGHPASFTQTHIDNEAAIASPFNMTVTNTWNATYDSVVTTVTVTPVSSWSATSPKLRAALVQTWDFPTPPGTNGETHFENVVQDMYPNAGGTDLSSVTWTIGVPQTFTIKGKVPSFVQRDKAPFMVVWLQNDGDKSIAQAAKAIPLPPIPNDAGITAVTTPELVCNANGSYSAGHTVTLKNTGSNPITSATIYYRVDGGTWSNTPWSGSLAPGATTTVTMPSASITVSGPSYHTFYDSVDRPNGVLDQSMSNNTYGAINFIQSTTGTAMPYTTSFEGTDYMKHYASDVADNNQTWSVFYKTTTPYYGHTGQYAVKYPNYNATIGTANVYTMPVVTTSSSSAIDFWVAYRGINGTENDKLEVVYSTNCGTSWTSLWSNTGSAMATMAPDPTYYFFPASDTQYEKYSVSLNTVPAGATIGFRATSDKGNNLWLDDINIHTVTSVNEVISSLGSSVYPNPAKDAAKLTFNLVNRSDVQIQLVDATGRTLNTLANETMEPGTHSVDINTSVLASGIYNVVIRTENGVFTERVTVTK